MSVISREARRLLCSQNPVARAPIPSCRHVKTVSITRQPRRCFHASTNRNVVKPFLLADIGEGIQECQIIQWFVKPGATVEQFDKICEVQSDKASVEITSRFDGVIQKLYYEADDMAKVGTPLVDIDVPEDIPATDQALLDGQPEKAGSETAQGEDVFELGRNDTKAAADPVPAQVELQPASPKEQSKSQKKPGKFATHAVPAVRHMTKQLGLNIADIEGTGREGRVMKEDVQRHVESLKGTASTTSSAPAPSQQFEDHVKLLTPVQSGMFKQMTRSLLIPHFLYTDTVDFTALNALRKKHNGLKGQTERLSPLPFIVKAASLALQDYPLLNAHLDTTNPDRPHILVKGQHDIGIAVDSPSGLLVPVIKNVQSHSISSLAKEISRLAKLAQEGKLTTADMSGATFTLSNIGSIGGGAVAPVIVSPQVAILGVGKAKAVPAFGENGEIIRKEECVFSWSADHRIIDGAMAARCADAVRVYLENIESMLVRLR